jgi:hypothetical protein
MNKKKLKSKIFTWLSLARWSFFIVTSISDSSFDIELRIIVVSLIFESIFGSSNIGEIASVCGWYNGCS